MIESVLTFELQQQRKIIWTPNVDEANVLRSLSQYWENGIYKIKNKNAKLSQYFFKELSYPNVLFM